MKTLDSACQKCIMQRVLPRQEATRHGRDSAVYAIRERRQIEHRNAWIITHAGFQTLPQAIEKAGELQREGRVVEVINERSAVVWPLTNAGS